MITGRVVASTGKAKWVPVYGMSLSSLALLLLGVLSPQPLTVGVLEFIAGLGFGTVMPINQVVVQTVAGRARLGAVTADDFPVSFHWRRGRRDGIRRVGLRAHAKHRHNHAGAGGN
jgi:hypothetical protein